MAFAMVEILANLVRAAPVTTCVSAAPFALVGLQRTMSESILRLTVCCSYELGLMVRVRFMHLERARGCTCMVSGVPTPCPQCLILENRPLTGMTA